MTASFATIVCAHGAEGLVKQSIAEAGWRLAFSRPGLVTAKHDSPHLAPPEGVFIRTSFRSLGMCRGETIAPMLEQLHALVAEHPRKFEPDHLHVFPKDRAAIGRFDFEPGVDEISSQVARLIAASLVGPAKDDSSHDDTGAMVGDDGLASGGETAGSIPVNQPAAPMQTVLDVVLVEPGQWMVGYHRSTSPHSCWPGGVQPIEPKYPPISRAYYKAAEAIAWSGFDLRENDLAIEIGSAPGGACGRLLEMGLRVIGIDPAEMDPRIARHPKFEHVRARGGDLPRSRYAGARWMLVDSNVRPDQTLTTVENIVQHPATSFEGLLLTMKIGGYPHADRIEKWIRRIKGWGTESIRVKQLARNKVEVCFAVELSRSVRA